MNENETKTRKQWRIMLIVTTAMNFIHLTAKPIDYPVSLGFPVWAYYLVLAYTVLAPLIMSYITYRCIYRKPGTRLLTFLLIVSPIILVVGLVGYLSGKLPLPSGMWLAYLVLAEIAATWWYVLLWKMRKINKKLQRS